MSGINAAVLGNAQNVIYVPGLVQGIYSGYAGSNAAFFDNRGPFSTAIAGSPISYTSFSSSQISVLWIGYIRPTVTGTITFSFSVSLNDASNYNMFWVGPQARSGYTAANANFQGQGGSAATTVSAGLYYPIRLQLSYEGNDGFFDDPELFFSMQVNGVNSYPIFYNSLTQGF
jgi:hypothetical protein